MIGFVGAYGGVRARSGLARPAVRSRVSRRRVAVCVTEVPSQAPTVLPKKDDVSFVDNVGKYVQQGVLPKVYAHILLEWYKSYAEAAKQSGKLEEPAEEFTDRYFHTLFELCKRQMMEPYKFELFHQSLRKPFDYYKFGLEFADPVINFPDSQVVGVENLEKISKYLEAGDNVIILSNHQSEGEPHAIDTVLRSKTSSTLGEKMIFMAGDRVREDLLAVPFTLGRNIVTVYSKKHIDDVPELKPAKQNHNKRTIQEVTRLFREGGKLLWLAPSGGRDRRSKETGRVELSRFDPDAIETMRFIAARSGKPTHFFPMAVTTYELLPPPETVDVDMGEKRVVKHVPVNLWFGDEIDMEKVATGAEDNKLKQRELRAEHIIKLVEEGYDTIGGFDQ